MDTWRLIIDPPQRGSDNMARDYAILKHVARGGMPTVRMYRWAPAAVTIGYFQVRDDETDYDACSRDRIPVIRRITGGGAVFHDAEVTYSVAVPLGDPRLAGTVIDTYRYILRPVMDALGKYSIDAEYRPVNDIITAGKKISGSAQTRREGGLLQHGTVLLSLDRSRMFRYLKVSAAKATGRVLDEASRGVTAVDEMTNFAGDEQAVGTFIETMAASFADAFDVRFEREELSESEIREAAEIERSVFLNGDWNDKRKKST
jgi:lipoate-protein ligase A